MTKEATLHRAATDNDIEAEIRAKGKTAPRLTPADIEAVIVSEYYINAGEATAHCANPDDHGSMSLLTFCVLVLRNGFTVTGESACVSPENFDVEIGRKVARAKAIEKIWPLEGYLLKQRMHNASMRPNPANGAPRPIGHNPVG